MLATNAVSLNGNDSPSLPFASFRHLPAFPILPSSIWSISCPRSRSNSSIDREMFPACRDRGG